MGIFLGKYYPDKNAIDFEPIYRPESFSPSSGFETIPLHEFGHSVDRAGKQIPEKTKDLIKMHTMVVVIIIMILLKL
ncbi:MAG: hypothetical protein CM15mV51_0730 [uncultured marine virus]|nr:MAG: hypothetical protein CM15mV51_0730 [uncultured marine virus]